MPSWLSRRWTIWSSPQGQVPGKYPFDRVTIRIFRAGLWLAPSWWLIDTRKGCEARTTERDQNETALYVLCWLVVLVLFWLISPSDDTAATILGCFALLRLFE
ncbi:MAG TPA: hypothetical protein VNY31_01285, partial [Solirubrobacteraceae bacterium]|nr:hypothetical protein [Solirubrobacteraceae bacterium]